MSGINATDIGRHYLKLQEVGVPDREIGRDLRLFVETFAPLIAAEKGKEFFGVIIQDTEEENDGGV